MKKRGIWQIISDLWYGKDNPTGSGSEWDRPTPQSLQEAVALKMRTATAKGDAASAQMVTALNARAELGKLAMQYDELDKQALLAEKSGDSQRAKKILSFKLAIKPKLQMATERYEHANKLAVQLVQEARMMFMEAKEASEDLPRKVMQLEVNQMLEKAALLEEDSQMQQEGKATYEALSASIDVQTQRLLVRDAINETGKALNDEIEQFLADSALEEEYRLLQKKAEADEDVINAEFFEENTSERERHLLPEPTIGGLLPNMGDTSPIRNDPLNDQPIVISAEKTKPKESEETPDE